jgi:hypothetical protein
LAAFSLAIAFFLWLIAKREESDADVLQIPVRLQNVPAYIEARAQPTEVQATLQFPRALKSEIVPDNFFVAIDFQSRFQREDAAGGAFPGGPEFRRQTVPLESSHFQREEHADLPLSQINIERFRPPDVYIEARHRGKTVPVEPLFQGEPAPDFRLNRERVQIKPAQVYIAGALEDLEQINSVFTEPIDVAGRRATRPNETVRLHLPRGLSEVPWNTRLKVEIAAVIEPVIAERDIQNIPFWAPVIAQNVEMRPNPPQVSIRVRGPKNLLEELGAESFEFFLEEDVEETPGRNHEDVPFDAKVRRTVPRAKEGVYEIVSVEPARVDILFVDKSSAAASASAGVSPSGAGDAEAAPAP